MTSSLKNIRAQLAVLIGSCLFLENEEKTRLLNQVEIEDLVVLKGLRRIFLRHRSSLRTALVKSLAKDPQGKVLKRVKTLKGTHQRVLAEALEEKRDQNAANSLLSSLN